MSTFNPAPNEFRDQYAGGVKEIPEFEQALAGSAAPRLSLPPVTAPLGEVRWDSHGAVRLR